MSRNVLTVILGRKGTGKTTVAASLVGQEAKGRGRIVVIDPVGEYPGGHRIAPSDPDLRYFLQNQRFSLRIHPIKSGDLDAILPLLLRTGNLMVVIDEAQLFQDATMIPDVLTEFITLGRRPAVDQVFITQRPTMLNRTITSQLDQAYLFGTREPRDLAYLSAYISDVAASKVSQLEKFSYLRFVVPDTYTIHKVNKIPLAGQIPTSR